MACNQRQQRYRPWSPIAGRSTWLQLKRDRHPWCPCPVRNRSSAVPPVCSAAWARSGIPSPVFLCFVVKKGSRTFASVSASIPLPSSITSITEQVAAPVSWTMMISIVFASARTEFSAISRIWSEMSSTASALRLPAVPACQCLFDLGHGPVFDRKAGKPLSDIFGTVGIRTGDDRILPAIRESFFCLGNGHVLPRSPRHPAQARRDEPELSDDAERFPVHMSRDHEAVALCRPGRLQRSLRPEAMSRRSEAGRRNRSPRPRHPRSPAGRRNVHHSSLQVPVNELLELQEIVVIIKEHQEVRFLGGSDFHPAEHHQPVPAARLLHGQDVLRRVMVAHPDQVDAPSGGPRSRLPGATCPDRSRETDRCARADRP